MPTITPLAPLFLSQEEGGRPTTHITHVPRRILMALIWVYQNTLGPALPPSCRYEPSCSRYAYQAVKQYGALRGAWYAIKRLARCHPWGGSGFDPVPEPHQ